MTFSLVKLVRDKPTACVRETLTGSAVPASCLIGVGIGIGVAVEIGIRRISGSALLASTQKPIAISIATPIPIATPKNSVKRPALRGKPKPRLLAVVDYK